MSLPAGTVLRPWLSASMLLLIALAFGVQQIWPGLLPCVQRDATAVQQGQVYRLFTALWFQDGGFAGAVFNLTTLLVVGSFAEAVWSRRDWLLIYFGTGLLTGTLALRWQPVGAGNSIACFGLAGGLLVMAARPAQPLPLRAVQLVGLCAGVALALHRDIHGAALLLGAGLSLILSRLRRSRASAAAA